jgi:hypothetical protein
MATLSLNIQGSETLTAEVVSGTTLGAAVESLASLNGIDLTPLTLLYNGIAATLNQLKLITMTDIEYVVDAAQVGTKG